MNIDRSKIETFQLGPFQMPRLFNGLWQVSSPSWGPAGGAAQEGALLAAARWGLTAADMADHYVGDLILSSSLFHLDDGRFLIEMLGRCGVNIR